MSLLNYPVKLITKILALRLQDRLQSLIDIDQSGFVRSRSLSDSFIYAHDLVQTCKLKKKKTGGLKTGL
jgi:hypothetical protein